MQHTATEDKQTTDFALLSCEELAAVHGGVMRVMVTEERLQRWMSWR